MYGDGVDVEETLFRDVEQRKVLYLHQGRGLQLGLAKVYWGQGAQKDRDLRRRFGAIGQEDWDHRTPTVHELLEESTKLASLPRLKPGPTDKDGSGADVLDLRLEFLLPREPGGRDVRGVTVLSLRTMASDPELATGWADAEVVGYKGDTVTPFTGRLPDAAE